jgi:hypothetical protein
LTQSDVVAREGTATDGVFLDTDDDGEFALDDDTQSFLLAVSCAGGVVDLADEVGPADEFGIAADWASVLLGPHGDDVITTPPASVPPAGEDHATVLVELGVLADTYPQASDQLRSRHCLSTEMFRDLPEHRCAVVEGQSAVHPVHILAVAAHSLHRGDVDGRAPPALLAACQWVCKWAFIFKGGLADDQRAFAVGHNLGTTEEAGARRVRREVGSAGHGREASRLFKSVGICKVGYS